MAVSWLRNAVNNRDSSVFIDKGSLVKWLRKVGHFRHIINAATALASLDRAAIYLVWKS
jgi:hypothetical protein